MHFFQMLVSNQTTTEGADIENRPRKVARDRGRQSARYRCEMLSVCNSKMAFDIWLGRWCGLKRAAMVSTQQKGRSSGHDQWQAQGYIAGNQINEWYHLKGHIEWR